MKNRPYSTINKKLKEPTWVKLKKFIYNPTIDGVSFEVIEIKEKDINILRHKNSKHMILWKGN